MNRGEALKRYVVLTIIGSLKDSANLGRQGGLDLYLPDMQRYELRATSLKSSELNCQSGCELA